MKYKCLHSQQSWSYKKFEAAAVQLRIMIFHDLLISHLIIIEFIIYKVNGLNENRKNTKIPRKRHYHKQTILINYKQAN